MDGTLPESIIAKIFSYLDPATLDSCLQANKDWESIIKIDGYFGDYDFLVWTCRGKETPPFKPLGNIGDQYVTQGWVSVSKRSAQVPRQFLQWKDPLMLKTLWFDGYVSPFLFNDFTLSTINLHQLIIHSSAFSGIDTAHYNFGNNFQNLETFSFKFRAVNPYRMKSVGECALKQIRMLNNERMNFPKLKEFNFEGINLGKNFGSQYKNGIYSFITRHATTLKNLSILFNTKGKTTLRIKKPEHVNQLDLNLFNLDIVEVVGAGSVYSELTQIKRMNSITFLRENYDFDSITSLNIKYLHPIPQYSNTTLTNLVLDLQFDINQQQLDLVIFQNCNNLANLGLRISNPTPHSFIIIGAKYLPNSIQNIELHNFLISNIECKGLFRNRRNLKYLFVELNFHCAEADDFGFAIEDLLDIYDQRIIEEFHLNYCLNKKMFTDDLNNNNHTNQKLALLIGNDFIVPVRSKLNTRTGLYESLREEFNYVRDFHLPHLGRKHNGHFPFRDMNLFLDYYMRSDDEDED